MEHKKLSLQSAYAMCMDKEKSYFLRATALEHRKCELRRGGRSPPQQPQQQHQQQLQLSEHNLVFAYFRDIQWEQLEREEVQLAKERARIERNICKVKAEWQQLCGEIAAYNKYLQQEEERKRSSNKHSASWW